MNREIKFRGKDIKTGKWVYGFYYEVPVSGEKANIGYIIKEISIVEKGFNKPFHQLSVIEVDINSVGTYTGMKDVKGQEIYENDILKFTQLYNISYDTSDDIETKEFYTDVKWEEGCFWIKDDGDDDYRDFLGAFIGDVYPLTDIEVVGNIHDNPELLEE
ncbi:YopX family protein [Clostridium perfringens]|nr:YopX family protein [Clostridium perfringens]